MPTTTRCWRTTLIATALTKVGVDFNAAAGGAHASERALSAYECGYPVGGYPVE